MRGAVAAGNPHTADAGAWALLQGGNAVDAVVASAIAAFVTEGPLTGPAGGGFLLLRDADGSSTLLDCFFVVPSAQREPMDEIVIDFGDASTQIFHVGHHSVAVPGLVAGLARAHAEHGHLPWRTLCVPALDLARTGVDMTPAQRFLLEILVPILERTDEGRGMYGSHDRAETQVMVPWLERLRDGGQAEGQAAVADLMPAIADDVAQYRVIERAPLESGFARATVLTCPPPSLGGRIVAGGLAAVDPDVVARRDPLPVTIAHALLAGYRGPSRLAPLTGTTHVSVVDADGAAAALSSTLGSGSGVFASGFQLNNMLGELDVIGTREREPGGRLPSMMAPTIVLEDGLPRLVLGSAGSVRLSGAILQVVYHVVAGRLPVAEAIDHPRLHVEVDAVQVEGGWPAETAEQLAQAGHAVNPWAARNLYFGGVSAVERHSDGTLLAAGDPRRGGHGVVVP